MASSDDLRVLVLDVLPPEGVQRFRKAGDSFDRLALKIDGTLLVGNGSVAPAALAGTVDAVYTQAAVVVAPAALTGAAPAALTGAAPAALTAVAAVDVPTKAEYDALLADVTALRTTVAANVVDIAALRVAAAANVVDIAALRTTLAAVLVAIKGTGKPMASA